MATISKRDEILVIELSALHHRPVFAVIHCDTTRGVRIRLEDWKFSQVIVGCEDPEALQAEIAGG